MSGELTRTLAEFALEHRYAEVPATTQAATLRTIRNAVGLAVGAAEHHSVVTTREVAGSLRAEPRLSLLGREQQLGTFSAPLVNAMAMHVEDYDDTHLRTIVHPGAPIVPAALGAAELAGADGGEVCSGVLVGVEAALRVANSICPEHFDLGWHLTGTAGHLGAAVAAGRVLGLTLDQLVAAIGLGVTQAAGFTSANGTMTKALHPGKAAADGLEAALLARRGFTGPAEPLVGRRGFATIASPRLDVAEILGDLGQRWEGELNAIKPYACGIVSHAAIDAAKAVRAQVDAADLDEIEVRIPKVVLEVMGISDPGNALESKFSVRHCVAVGLVDGDGSPREFSDERAVAPDLVAVRDRVTPVIDSSVPKGAAVVRATTGDGREFVEEVIHATASAERPMTDGELAGKFRKLTEPRLGPSGAEHLWSAVEQLPAAPHVGDVVAASRP